jgi:heat shock protein HslJ
MIISMKHEKKPVMVPGLFWIFPGLMVVFMAAACADLPSARDAGFSGILGKDWELVEIRIETGAISLDRARMEADGLGDAFTLKFEEDRLSGMALPNRYFGPYTRKGQAIEIKGLASTLMAAFKELEALKEHDYFGYLERTQSWEVSRNALELHSAAPDGQKAVLVFLSR